MGRRAYYCDGKECKNPDICFKLGSDRNKYGCRHTANSFHALTHLFIFPFTVSIVDIADGKSYEYCPELDRMSNEQYASFVSQLETTPDLTE